MENRKGLSAVVTTLIIILLVLVAVGIIWVVVRNLVESGAEQIEVNTKCIAVDVRAVSVLPVSGEDGNYTVSLNRQAGGGDIGGVKINVFNDTDSSGVIDFNNSIEALNTETERIDANGVTGANKIQFTVFFLDASGNEQLCTTTKEFTF